MDDFLSLFFPDVWRQKQAPNVNDYCKFDSQILTTFTSSLYVAGLIASFVASTVTRKYGRKPSMLSGGLSFLAGSALNGFAMNVPMLIVGRILLGVGVGFANQVRVAGAGLGLVSSMGVVSLPKNPRKERKEKKRMHGCL